MKYLKIFESFDDTNKYLIELGSANSRGVNSKSSNDIKLYAEKSEFTNSISGNAPHCLANRNFSSDLHSKSI